MKGVGFLRKIQLILIATLTICKSFVRPHLDCVDVFYDQPLSESFSNNMETVR